MRYLYYSIHLGCVRETAAKYGHIKWRGGTPPTKYVFYDFYV